MQAQLHTRSPPGTMRVLLSSIVAGLLCSLAAAQPLTNVCHYSPQPGVTFDVCALSSSSNEYVPALTRACARTCAVSFTVRA
ncbi:hypothetical protein EON67_06940, partial [archaeon]